jgi:hypothetical protein
MSQREKVRIGGFVVIAVAAVVVMFALGGSGDAPGATAEDVETALAGWELNEDGSESAPQQSVSAQWAAKDLLAVIGRAEARQSGALSTKIPALLLLGVLSLCWQGVTGPVVATPETEPGAEPADSAA